MVGLLDKSTVEEKAKSTWGSITNKGLDHYIHSKAPITDAQKNIEKVFSKGIEKNGVIKI